MKSLRQIKNSLACLLLILGLGSVSYVQAGDNQRLSGTNAAAGSVSAASTANPMPTLQPGMYGTQAGDPNSGNMGQYLCRDKSPIAFTVNIPDTDPSNRSATLQMAVYDVDADASNPEVDTASVNGVKVGILNGTNDQWFYDVFNVPIKTLKQGPNLVTVSIDDNNGGWCVQVDWAVIALTGGAVGTVEIPRAWITPSSISSSTANTINLFAEVSGTNIASVTAYYGSQQLTSLIPDPSKNGTYSGQFVVPAGLAPGFYKDVFIKAVNSNGNEAYWPGIMIRQ